MCSFPTCVRFQLQADLRFEMAADGCALRAGYLSENDFVGIAGCVDEKKNRETGLNFCFWNFDLALDSVYFALGNYDFDICLKSYCYARYLVVRTVAVGYDKFAPPEVNCFAPEYGIHLCGD